MNNADPIAFDTHTHAEASCWNPFDNCGEAYDRATDKYSGFSKRPTIEETIAHYREMKIGLVMFTVESESQLGRRRMRCGDGLRLQNSNPMLLEDVAIDFPDMQIVVAHPSWPWQDEALSLALHKPNVWIDLSGWSPKYFPAQLVQYANTLLKDRMLFGSNYPLITPERWMKDFATWPRSSPPCRRARRSARRRAGSGSAGRWPTGASGRRPPWPAGQA
jgi:predicted TIM-barrel fold metal-dependent hydrolase